MYTQQGKGYVAGPEQLLHTVAAMLPSNQAKFCLSEVLQDSDFSDV